MKLLFERLTEHSAHGHDGPSSLRQSVMEEVARLLSSRSYFGGLERDPGIRAADPADPLASDIFRFGIPRAVDYFGNNVQDLAILRRCIKEAIVSGEPRIRQVSVDVESPKTPFDPITVHITGLISAEEGQEWARFPVELAPM